MHMIFRTMMVMARARRRAKRGDTVGFFDVGYLTLRTLPTDLDVLWHMNNGVYLSIFDLGRFDLMVRNGMWDQFQERGWYPVVSSQSVTYRKSLRLWQRFTVETRVIGMDEKAGYIEHRMVVNGEIYTRAIMKARFLRKSGGTVPISELMEAVGIPDPRLPMEEWIEPWGAAVALPPTKAPAPSEWD
ncbi:acyl-CoA thioesterase [Mycetocola spongiae]|uniref:acyl-CoA thioesterase n=1 Tax=Mycetocola spongiae TaxID=2859226 RepID=UPI001CF19CF3|nr:thioesterase family protein [Mycetocola spongiae]UCR88170.1 thioesterase family protein [Mycetocola spongiae]